MSFQYDFPSELLLAVFGEVESNVDLLALAATCRQFNHVSLQVFFSNNNFNPNSKTITSDCHCRPLEMISAMAMSLALRKTSLEHLSFNFGHHDMRKIRILTRYVRNLSTIDRVTLQIVIPWPYSPVSGDWKAAYVALLDTVIGKSCSNLHIKTSAYNGDILPVPKSPSWSRIPGRHPKAMEKSDGEVQHLKDCFIERFPSFLRPFYLSVLRANASVLTSLAFTSVSGRMTAVDWGFLITNVHLPVLKRFAINFSMIPEDAMIKFLFRHPHLTHFEYHHIQYTAEPKGVPHTFKNVFKHLEQLTTTPEHVLTFLPTMDRMPCLKLISIVIIENGDWNLSVVHHALRRLSSCIKKIELRLDVGLPFMPLFERVDFRSSFWREGGFMLRCVESLHIRCEWQYTAKELDQIPAWLKQFPELTKLTLNESGTPSWLGVERNTLPPFFQKVKLACPAITSIYLQGELEWTL